MKPKKPKLYKCREKAKGCFTEGYQWTSNFAFSGNKYCCQNPNCVLQRTVKLREKKEANKRVESHREKKATMERLKTRGAWLREAQVACNAYIRERDKHLPCVSCGRHHQGQYHAGHYQGVKAKGELRFHPSNINKQCQPCNEHLSGNLLNYRSGLIERVGLEMVDYLDNFNSIQRLTIQDVKEIIRHYKEKLKEINAQ